MPVCLKCGYELVFGPAGCACTQAARRDRQLEEADAIGERITKLVEAMNKPFAPVMPSAPAEFEYTAIDSILAATSRYQVYLVNEAMRISTGKVTAAHVEQAIRNLRKE